MPTIKIYSKEQVDALISSAGGLPDPTSASAGDVLTLDSNKDPAWSEPDPGLPDTTSASAGDILALDSNKDPAWVTPSGGSGMAYHTYTSWANLFNDLKTHCNEGLLFYGGNGEGTSVSLLLPIGFTKVSSSTVRLTFERLTGVTSTSIQLDGCSSYDFTGTETGNYLTVNIYRYTANSGSAGTITSATSRLHLNQLKFLY